MANTATQQHTVIDLISSIVTAAISAYRGDLLTFDMLSDQSKTELKTKIMDRIEYVHNKNKVPYDLRAMSADQRTEHKLFCQIVDTFI
jgi:hypothetical protein